MKFTFMLQLSSNDQSFKSHYELKIRRSAPISRYVNYKSICKSITECRRFLTPLVLNENRVVKLRKLRMLHASKSLEFSLTSSMLSQVCLSYSHAWRHDVVCRIPLSRIVCRSKLWRLITERETHLPQLQSVKQSFYFNATLFFLIFFHGNCNIQSQ